MQIKTITKNSSSASLRKMTLGHAVRILITEVLQAGGRFVYSWPRGDRRPLCETMRNHLIDDAEGFFFSTDDADYEFRGNEKEVERFQVVADLAIKAGTMKAEKFDPYSQKIWLLSVLNRHEWDGAYCWIVRGQTSSLLSLADEIDRVVNRNEFLIVSRAA